MDSSRPELNLEESVRQVMQTLPPVIRAYLTGGKYTVVAKSLMSKYGLRIDQGGILEREIMLLLMGIEDPDQFTQALVEEAKLDQKVIGAIIQDINAQIFAPLKDEERKAGTATPQQPARSTAPRPPAGPIAAGARATVPPPQYYAPPPQSPKYFHLDNKLPASAPPLPAPLRQVAPGVAPLPPKSVLPRPVANPAPKPGEKMLADHEEPHINLEKNAPPPRPMTPSPPAASKPELREALRTVLPPSSRPPAETGKPPPNLPGAPPPSDIVPPAPKPPPAPYPADPYREPIE